MNKEYQSTDKDTIVLLLTAEIPVKHFFVDDHKKTVFVFDFEAANEVIKAHIRGELPKYDYDKFIKALRLFNSIVHSG
jgi:hypothetical protein